MLLNFLKAILPNEGVKCWVSITEKKAANHFCDSFEELADQILASDANGVDTYHACAAFDPAKVAGVRSGRGRTQLNALGARSFWADVDCGEGKQYATQDIAIQECDAFCDRYSLPVPGLVRSGGGLHLYWPCSRVFTPDEWLAIAQRLKLLMQASGFSTDAGSLAQTTDIARILRSPGTKNYKIPGHPRPVTLDDFEYFEPIHEGELIESLLKNVDGNPSLFVNNALKSEPVHSPSLNQNILGGMKVSTAFDPTKGVAAGSRGSTQLRYAGELVAKGYAFEEVLEKCRVWNQRCTPPQEDAEVVRVTRSAFSCHARNHPNSTPAPPPVAAAVTGTEETLPQLPQGYRWGPNQELVAEIWEASLTEEGKKDLRLEVISKWPLYMQAQLNQEGHGQKCGYLFQQCGRQGWQEIIMSSREMNGQDWYASWYEKGGEISPGADKQFKTYVRRASAMLRDSKDKVTQYSQFGWKDGNQSVMVGEWVYHNDGSYQRAYGTPKLQPIMDAMKPARGGSLQSWSRAANKLFMPGMEPHAFALLASFGSLLMPFVVDEGNGGSIISLVSEESGTGKTPTATAVASVWGSLGSVVDTGNFTENRLIEDLVRHCHLPVVREEMPYSDPQVAADGVKKFTSGSDRGRLNQSGAATGIPERYQNILMSISNKSLYRLVRMVDVPMSRRVFEIEVPRPDKEYLTNLGNVVREMMLNCGQAGPQFARICVDRQMQEYIRQHLAGEHNQVGSTVMRYREKLNSLPEHRFIVWPIACIDVAARILTHAGILSFDVERMMAWVCRQAVEIMHTSERIPQCIQKLTRFLSEHTDCCIVVPRPFKVNETVVPLRMPQRKMAMRMEMNPHKLYICFRSLEEWCVGQNISAISLGKELSELKILTARNKMVSLGAGTHLTSGRVYCWEIDMTNPEFAGIPRLEETAAEMVQSLTAT